MTTDFTKDLSPSLLADQVISYGSAYGELANSIELSWKSGAKGRALLEKVPAELETRYKDDPDGFGNALKVFRETLRRVSKEHGSPTGEGVSKDKKTGNWILRPNKPRRSTKAKSAQHYLAKMRELLADASPEAKAEMAIEIGALAGELLQVFPAKERKAKGLELMKKVGEHANLSADVDNIKASRKKAA